MTTSTSPGTPRHGADAYRLDTRGPNALDPGRLQPLPGAPASTSADPLDFPHYRDKLAAAATDSGADESLTTGTVRLGGGEVVVAIGRFGFMGGSMGLVHGDRVAHAMAYAREHHLPFLAVISSGGARMQEGMVALHQMSRAAEGVRALREAGLPVLAHFRHPTTGGVHASYGALADVIVADAGATVGFAGPRVVAAVSGHEPGPESHTAEAALAGGLVDEVVADDAIGALDAWVALVHPALRDGPLPVDSLPPQPEHALPAWEATTRARARERPTARNVLASVFDDHRELHGDRAGDDDPVAIVAVARLGGRRVMVLGTDRSARGEGPERLTGQATAAGYRKLTRGAQLAARWGLPLVTLIDTVGADPTPASDRSGLARAVGETFVATLEVAAPTIAIVVGEGGSGGALALGCTDRLLIQDDAVFEVIAPEGAAAILHRDRGRAEDVAPLLRPTAHELRDLALADRVLPGPTTTSAATANASIRAAIATTLTELDGTPDRLAARRDRYGPTSS
ncbi:MAG: carboxyl transferase domain-containing protein [Nitriliruptoraceae bacterium]